MESIICEKCGDETDVSEEGQQLIMVVCSCGHRIKGPAYPKFERFQPHKAELNAHEIKMLLALDRILPKDVSEFMEIEYEGEYGNFIRKLSRGYRGYNLKNKE